MLPTLFYYVQRDTGKFLCHMDNDINDMNDVYLADPVKDRNDIINLIHSTDRKRADEWLSFLRKHEYMLFDSCDLSTIEVVEYGPAMVNVAKKKPAKKKSAMKSWKKSRDAIMGNFEPPGSYGLCWKSYGLCSKEIQGKRCVRAIDHKGKCSSIGRMEAK